MSNLKQICPNSNFALQVQKAAGEISAELSKLNLNCQIINFIIQDSNYQIHRHTLELAEPTNNFTACANLLIAVLNNYKGNQHPKCMCLQISKFSVAA